MGLNLKYQDEQTTLEKEEREGLRISTISSHTELDEYEQLNIQIAEEWLIGKNLKAEKVLTEGFIKLLHKKMYSDVWKWAGQFRKTEKNIGVKWISIGIELKALLDDTNFWIEQEIYPIDEIALKFKHRLVSIHCFPNGNGRHSRLMADVLIEKIFKQPRFSWGRISMLNLAVNRSNYIKALQAADQNNMIPLSIFARS